MQTKLVHTLTYMSEWLTANGLKLNIDKTKCILNKTFHQIACFKSHIMRLM